MRKRKPPVPVPITDHGSPFVSRVGTKLFLNGNPYRFIGFNMWRAACSASAPNNLPPNNGGYPLNDGTTLSDTLDSMVAGAPGLNIIRTWFFQQFALASGGNQNPSSTYDWRALDKVLSVANSKNIKVIACLADQWDFETDNVVIGPSWKDGNWWQPGGYDTVHKFYEAYPYRQWVRDCVTRYKDNTTIAFWEIINEGEVANSDETPWTNEATASSIYLNFVNDIGGLIKSIDSRHLVSTGCAGQGNAGILDADYQTIHANQYVDLLSFHDYYGAANASAFNASNGLNIRMASGAALSKPVYIGECGIKWDVAPCATTTDRAGYLDAKMQSQFGQGICGYLCWQHSLAAGVGGDTYMYQSGDPAYPKMQRYVT